MRSPRTLSLTCALLIAAACSSNDAQLGMGSSDGGDAANLTADAPTDTGGGGSDAAADAGSCCPSDWELHACTFSAGGAGMACHNPALGCASSQTCGEGCDSVVAGRCGADAGGPEDASGSDAAAPDAHGSDAETDSGTCCPAGWLLFSCSYPDGGAGMACHNPALGCASSTTCGGGCDSIVSGRCVGEADGGPDAGGVSRDSGTDAGNCCPSTWSLYSCTNPDGGTGMACHNPAEGCASSLTCGLGCDRVVAGRCGP